MSLALKQCSLPSTQLPVNSAELRPGQRLRLQAVWSRRVKSESLEEEGRKERLRRNVFPGVKSYSKERLTAVWQIFASLSFNSWKACESFLLERGGLF